MYNHFIPDTDIGPGNSLNLWGGDLYNLRTECMNDLRHLGTCDQDALADSHLVVFHLLVYFRSPNNYSHLEPPLTQSYGCLCIALPKLLRAVQSA